MGMTGASFSLNEKARKLLSLTWGDVFKIELTKLFIQEPQ
jgi:hypothetical protein